MRPIYPAARVAGSAVTVLVPGGRQPDDSRRDGVVQPGDILVVTTTSESTDGMFGELLAGRPRARRRRPGDRRRRPRHRGYHGDGLPGVVESHSRAGHDEDDRRLGQRRRSSAPARRSIPATSSSPTPTAWSSCRGQAAARSPTRQPSAWRRRQKTRERLEDGELGLDIYGLRAKLTELGVQYLDDRGND